MKKEYWVIVEHVDNRLVVSVNGEKVWDSDVIYDDPLMNKRINITDFLRKDEHAVNEVIFEGYNGDYGLMDEKHDMNPWHFTYRMVCRSFDELGNLMEERDLIKPYDEKHMSNPDMWAINNRYQLAYANDKLVVKSNFLSQQFAE